MNWNEYRTGVHRGLPVGMGYFSVSFGFGAMAIAQGLSVWYAVLISATNLTSAGQFAGLTVIAAGAAILEMILTQLVINSRYALMSLALGQKFGPSVGTGRRLACAFFNTDEIFAVSSSKSHPVGARYFSGLATAPYIGWALGTLLGAVAGNILPPMITQALGLALYAMFIAIILPPMKAEKGVLPCVVLAAGVSCVLTFVPCFSFLSGGFVIIISSIVSAFALSAVMPIREEETLCE